MIVPGSRGCEPQQGFDKTLRLLEMRGVRGGSDGL
jgi:hypothetical protein